MCVWVKATSTPYENTVNDLVQVFNALSMLNTIKEGGIAQLVERCPCKAEVSGSSPLISTRTIHKVFICCFGK
jgi:hypothetical protein